jgi:transposase
MDLALYAVTAVLVEGRSVRSVAAATGRSKSWVQRHCSLYREGGEAALVPKKRGPKRSPNQTAPEVEDAILTLRKQLDELGLDAGSRTIAYHLGRQGLKVPAISTIHRILHRRGFVTPQPQKRPRSSWQRFEADLPNECWQTDMTHWHLEGERQVEIINFIDDYSRAVLASVAVPVATATEVVRLFFDTAATWGLPQSVLSDNGAIYTAAYRGASTGLEIWPGWASPSNTASPTILRPRGRSSAITARSRPTCAADHRPRTWPGSRPRSISSSPPTTRSGPTRLEDVRPCRRGDHSTGPPPSSTVRPFHRPPRSDTTRSTPPGPSPCATGASCTTSASAEPTRASGCSSSSATSTFG